MWIPQERNRVEREFQNEKKDNILNRNKEKDIEEEMRRKMAERNAEKMRDGILEQISELKRGRAIQDLEFEKPPNIFEEAKHWLVEERPTRRISCSKNQTTKRAKESTTSMR